MSYRQILCHKYFFWPTADVITRVVVRIFFCYNLIFYFCESFIPSKVTYCHNRKVHFLSDIFLSEKTFVSAIQGLSMSHNPLFLSKLKLNWRRGFEIWFISIWYQELRSNSIQVSRFVEVHIYVCTLIKIRSTNSLKLKFVQTQWKKCSLQIKSLFYVFTHFMLRSTFPTLCTILQSYSRRKLGEETVEWTLISGLRDYHWLPRPIETSESEDIPQRHHLSAVYQHSLIIIAT